MLLATPFRRFVAALVLGAAVSAAALGLALGQRSLGLALGVEGEAEQRVVVLGGDAQGAASEVPVGSTVRGLSVADGRRSELEPVDLIEESDFLPSYAEIERFFERQQALSELLEEPAVEVEFTEDMGSSRLIHTRLGAAEFTVLQPTAQIEAEGALHITLPEDAIHLFDAGTGRRLAGKATLIGLRASAAA